MTINFNGVTVSRNELEILRIALSMDIKSLKNVDVSNHPILIRTQEEQVATREALLEKIIILQAVAD